MWHRDPMSGTTGGGGLDDLLEPLSRCLDDESARRVEALAQRANQGSLTEEERAEYEALINAADFVAILKLKARHNLASHGG